MNFYNYIYAVFIFTIIFSINVFKTRSELTKFRQIMKLPDIEELYFALLFYYTRKRNPFSCRDSFFRDR